MHPRTKQRFGLLGHLRRRLGILAEDEIPPGGIGEPPRQQHFHGGQLLHSKAQCLIFFGVGVGRAGHAEVLHLGAETGHCGLLRPEQRRVGGRHGQQPIGQCSAQRQRLHHSIAQQLFGSAAALARGVRLSQRQHLGLRTEAEQELDAVRPVPCAHLPPAVQHQQTGPELCQRHPAQCALCSQLLTVHQPDAAVQRFAQLLRQPAAQFEPRGAGGHPEDAGVRLFCQHLPHDAALAGARRTHQRGPAALLQGGCRRTAGRFV